MAMTMHLNIVSAEQEIFSGTVEQVSAPALVGEIGIYPRHAQLLSPLKPGEIRVTKLGGDEDFFFVTGGVIEVQPHVVTVLADTAVRAKDLDEAKALESKLRAEQALKDRKGEIDLARAESELVEAVAQLQTIQKLRKKGRAK
jgi:F-type H+-transporting ATPase subunit epsilon